MATISTTSTTSTTSTISQLPQYTVTELNYGIAGATVTSTVSTSTPAAGSLYRANVLLPVVILNLDKPTSNKSFISCPITNLSPTTLDTTTGLYTNNLTNFGNNLLDLIINEFNTIFGTDFTTDQFGIMTVSTDQNSLCSYQVYSAPLNLTIDVWVQIGTETRVSIKFIDAIA